MVNKYLALAFGLLWLIFIVYAWSLSRRQTRLKKEVEDLQKKLAQIASDAPKT